MSKSRIPRTWAQVACHPAVAEVVHLPGDEVKYWIYLRSGWTAASDPGQVHMGNGCTVRQAIDDVFPVRRCDCDDCLMEAVERGEITSTEASHRAADRT